MADLIDREKLLEIYKNWIPQLSSKEDEGDRRGVETCIAVLEDANAVDAVSVIRCKDCCCCTVMRYDYNGEIYSCRCNAFSRTVKENDFCSFGERKTDG